MVLIKCQHGKLKSNCKECNGCVHGKLKTACKDCGGSRYCVHNRQKTQCKDCGGSAICEHGKHKIKCKDCGGKYICEHNRDKTRCKDCDFGVDNYKCIHKILKSSCKECAGCEHGKLKSNCKECNGCVHGKLKTACKECGGSGICEHNSFKSTCKDCGRHRFCVHGKQKTQCKECGGANICEHGKLKSYCKDCNGSQICKHKNFKAQCKDCGGSAICEHNRLKSYCKTCGGSQLCKTALCETVKNRKYDGYCLNCFIHLFPDQPNTRNYKTKEKAVSEYILEKFGNFSWITDKKIKDGCSSKRPDVLLDLGYQVIIVEVDENQHESYDCSCENKRIMLLSQDVGHRPIVFIRFNPDDYMSEDKKITSCWGNNKMGICCIKKTKIKEWNTRLEVLHNQIEYWTVPEHKSEKTIEVVELFYDDT